MACIITSVLALSVGAMVWLLRTAPYGWQDEHGFHLDEKGGE